ncbi:asparagine synthase (glutamine-hydrolyzing) [Streptomyces sp. NPDC051658]|uniref:asparagine synthase (glutamine-hydrolyzing) n=1 Tax=Streptomyces sp. NPDC051658 TaxID=3365667 RepID=UPI0037A3EB83
MCGISGIVAPAGVRHEWLNEMSKRLSHRGPDGHGTRLVAGDRVGFSMNLLAIVDQSVDPGPYRDADSEFLITFNGEIYNYVELAERWAIPLRLGESDAHLALRAYERFGPDCLSYFDGMFALAIYDPNEGSVFIARDRFGEKPLYYAQVEGVFLFASEVKSLQGVLTPEPKIPPEWLAIENSLYGNTPYNGVRLLEPGCSATVTLTTLEMRKQVWWELESTTSAHSSDEDYCEAYDHFSVLLHRAVNRRKSSVPSALLLSGGLDSAVLAFLLRPSVLLTARYPGYSRYDEYNLAKEVADAIDSELVTVEPTADDFRRHADLIVHDLDYPVGNHSLLSERMLYEAASDRGIKVVFGGTGPDEFLLGYVRNAIALDGQGAVEHSGLEAYGPMKSKFLHSVENGCNAADRYYRMVLRGPDPEGAARRFVHRCFDRVGDIGQAISLVEVGVALPAMLAASDKLASAFGIERRSPFLAHEWAEFCFNLPPKFKRDGVYSKRMLRDFARDIGVPKSVWAQVDKRGFASPVPQWLRTSLAGWCDEELEALNRAGISHYGSIIHSRGAAAASAQDSAGLHDRSRFYALLVSIWWKSEQKWQAR